MNLFRSGWARLAVVFVILVEMVLVAATYQTWTELKGAEQRLASLLIPAPQEDVSMTEYFETFAQSSPEENVRRAAESSARMDYDYTAATVKTRKSEFYLFLAALFVFPLAAALLYQIIQWVIVGFRKQHA